MKTVLFLKDHSVDGEAFQSGEVVETSHDAEADDWIKKGIAKEWTKPEPKPVTAPTKRARIPVADAGASGNDAITLSLAEIDALIEKRLSDQIDKRFKEGRQSPDRDNLSIQVGLDPKRDKFATFRDQCKAVYRMATGGLTEDDARRMKAAMGSNTLTDADGNAVVQPEFAMQIMDKAIESGQILSRVNRQVARGQYFSVPFIDESTRGAGAIAGGIQAYRLAEGGQYTSSKPTTGKLHKELEKIGCLWYGTDEFLSDSMPGFIDTITASFATAIVRKLEKEIISGTGAFQCTGILNAGCLKTITRTAASDIQYVDLTKMFGGLYEGGLNSVVVLYGWPAWTKLMNLTLAGTLTVPVVSAATATAGQGGGLPPLFGVPWIRTEFCSALGTTGDIIVADLSQYIMGMHAEGTQMATSIHFKFDTGDNAYRWFIRAIGAPWWRTTLTLDDNTTTVSPFVVLS